MCMCICVCLCGFLTIFCAQDHIIPNREHFTSSFLIWMLLLLCLASLLWLEPSVQSVQFTHKVSDYLWPHGLQHVRLPCPPVPGACSNSCPLSGWCHPTISSDVIPFSSCVQSFSASECFPVSQFFASGGQGTRASASAPVFPMNIQDWFPLELTGLFSL